MAPESADTETVLIMNPQSGSGDHAPLVRDRAAVLGYRVEETKQKNHAIDLAREAAAEGVSQVGAVGGDGTLNEVIRGVQTADALDRVTVGVIPAGTGNDFATNIGISGIDEGFESLDHGRRRRLDLGMADDQPFLNSCVAGITATASAETSDELKSRLGVFAYVLTTLQVAPDFQGIDLHATLPDQRDETTVWSGSATIVLIGNGRRFSTTGSEQANIEDELLDVTIIEDAATSQLVGDRARERLLGDDVEHIDRMLVSSLELSVRDDESVTFSLDGEIEEFTELTVTAKKGAVRMPVGESYEPKPT